MFTRPSSEETREMIGMESNRAARAALAVVTVAGLLLTAGCSVRGGSPDAEAPIASHEVQKIAIVTPEKESDYGWNQRGIWAAQEVTEELGIELDDHSNAGYDNTETILTQVAESGNDLVIAHASGFNTVGHRVGVATGVPTLVVDFENNVPGKVGTVIPAAEQGAYLAGVAAAHKTETGTVGIVASAENLNWFLMAGGFVQGARSVQPDLKIVIAYIGPAGYGDSAGGASVTKQVIAAGADVIMGMGDGATMGYLQAIETAKTDTPISYIATIGDVSAIVENPKTVLTSVLWNYTDTYRQVINDVEEGTFGTRSYHLTVENGGMSLQETENMSDDLRAAVEQAREAIIDGSVTVKRTTEKDQVQALIDARG